MSYIAHSQTIYRWVHEQGKIHFTTKYENIPPRYRNQVQKPEGTEEAGAIGETQRKPGRAQEADTTKEIRPKEEVVSPSVMPTRDVTHNSNYFTFKGGIYSPESDDLEDFDTRFGGEIAFGHYFHPNFALELGIGYFETEGTLNGFDPILGKWSEKDEITAVPLTLTAKGVLPLRNVDLFAAAGIGVYFVQFESDISTSTFGAFSFDDDDTVFGFNLGLGTNFYITQNVFFRIEGKYLWAEAEFEESFLGIPIEFEVDLDGFIVTGSTGFRF